MVHGGSYKILGGRGDLREQFIYRTKNLNGTRLKSLGQKSELRRVESVQNIHKKDLILGCKKTLDTSCDHVSED